MYQRKGKDPTATFPNFKMLIAANETVRTIVKELLEDLGLSCKGTAKEWVYLIHRNGEIGMGSNIKTFIDCAFSEMTLTELIDWKVVPVRATLAEIEEMVGHKLEIIEEEE